MSPSCLFLILIGVDLAMSNIRSYRNCIVSVYIVGHSIFSRLHRKWVHWVMHGLHLHVENKFATLSWTIGPHIDIATTFLYNLFNNHQSKANTLAVDLSSTVKLSKPCKKLIEILLSNAYPSVSYLDDETVKRVTIPSRDLNLAHESEFHSILHQTY